MGGETDNPSFSHGEPWDDSVGLLPGVREEGEAFTDRDGDGRFAAATGRCRGGSVFSLRIEAEEGRLPVNAGWLDAEDRNGNGIPDCRDLSVHPCHDGVATVIDNLGALLDIKTRRYLGFTGSSPHPEDRLHPAWLGRDLLAARPEGGYRSPAQIDAALAATNPPYPPEERERILPYLDPGPYETPAESGRTVEDDIDGFPPYAPVSFHAASREVLAAHWLHLAVSGQLVQRLGDPALWQDTFASRTGLPQWGEALPFGNNALACIVYRDEALALADRAIALRWAAPVGWVGFYRDIVEQAPFLFMRDFADLGSGIEAAVWVQMKADLAFRAVCMDPHPWGQMGGQADGCAAWAGWGLDRLPDDAAVPATQGVQQFPPMPYHWITRIRYPADPWTPWPAVPPYAAHMATGMAAVRWPGFTLAPPARYAVDSLGAAHGTPGVGGLVRVSGRFAAFERLDCASQEDFENLSGGKNLARRGITIHPESRADHEARRDWRVADPLPDGTTPVWMAPDGAVHRRVQPHVASLPRWNRRAVADAAAAVGPDWKGYPRMCGALALAHRESGLQGAQVYWPFKEDFDGLRDNGGIPTAGPQGDAWSENEPGYEIPWAYPLWLWDEPGYGWPVDDPVTARPFSPTIGDATGDFLFQCPGAGSGQPVTAFSFDCWMGPGSSFTLKFDTYNDIFLSLDRAPEGVPATQACLFVRGTNPGNPSVVETATNWDDPWRIEDADATFGRTGWWYHVLASVENEGTQTVFRVWVNGRESDSRGIEMRAVLPGLLRAGLAEELSIDGCDGLRFYKLLLEGPEAEERHRHDRFVRRGTYTSPLYVLDRSASPGLCQWTGVVPPGFPADALTVEVQGYSDAAGSVPAGPPVPCPASGPVFDLLAAGPVRSFRYRVLFRCDAVPAVLDDTPVFESIWFTFRRPGRAPAWRGWE